MRRLDPSAAWSSINANYLPPSGSSLVHPHVQSAHDACGLTGQRLLVEQAQAWQERNGPYWPALVEQEATGPRWVGQIGQVAWLTPFAPCGFHEVWAVVNGAADVTDLTEPDTQALGQGLSQVLAAYRDLEPGLVQLRPDRRRAAGPRERTPGRAQGDQPVQPGPGIPQRRDLLRAAARRGADRSEPGGGGGRRPFQVLGISIS